MGAYDPDRVAKHVKLAQDMRPWFTAQSDSILERIKVDTHEDVMLYHDAVSVLVAARQMIELVAGTPEAK